MKKVTPALTSGFSEKFCPKSKRSQVTIFIIAGILIISLVALFLVFRTGVIPGITESPKINPNVFLGSCIEDKIKKTIEIISSQGGYIENPLHKNFKFEDEKVFTNISFLCYNQNYYLPCINQEPMLIQHLKEEIDNYISEDVENCFDDLVLSLEKQAYVVDARYNGFEVELMEKKVVVEIDGELILTKSGETTKHNDFKIIVPSRFYDIVIVVQEIISQEARFCHFEHLGFMLFYPQFKIDKFRTSDLITIYTIEHRTSKETFRFAVRGCIIPPGM